MNDIRPRRSLGLAQLAFQSVSYMAPAVSVVFVTLVVYSAVGNVTPFSFVVAGVACLCVAVCVGELAAELPSSGGLSTFVSAGLGPQVGFVAGWLVLLFLLIAPGLMFLLLSFVVSDVVLAPDRGLALVGVPWWPWILSAAAITLALNLRGIRLSADVTGVLAVIEVGLVLALAWSILGAVPLTDAIAAFDPGATGAGISTVIAGAALAFVAFPGFDTAAYLAEDARRPSTDPPRAVLLAAAGITTMYVICGAALVVGLTGSEQTGWVLDDGNAWLALAAQVWGGASVAILVALVSSALAAANAAVAASSRLVQTLGRSGVLPGWLARIDRNGTPRAATVTVVTIGVATAIASSLIWGLGPAITTLATALATSALLAYLAVCPAVAIYFWIRRPAFRLVRHGIVPAIGATLLAFALVSHLGSAPPFPAVLGDWFVVAWAIAGVAINVWFGRTGAGSRLDDRMGSDGHGSSRPDLTG